MIIFRYIIDFFLNLAVDLISIVLFIFFIILFFENFKILNGSRSLILILKYLKANTYDEYGNDDGTHVFIPREPVPKTNFWIDNWWVAHFSAICTLGLPKIGKAINVTIRRYFIPAWINMSIHRLSILMLINLHFAILLIQTFATFMSNDRHRWCLFLLNVFMMTWWQLFLIWFWGLNLFMSKASLALFLIDFGWIVQSW